MEHNPYEAPRERAIAIRGMRLTTITVVALLVVLAAMYFGLEFAARLIRGLE